MNPGLPVSDCRTIIHGITIEQLQTTSYTLRQAQAALMQLCSSNTIIVGHGLYNDLNVLRFRHR